MGDDLPPPYTPVTIGALVGRDVGHFAHPIRRTAAHDWHERNGAVMMNAGAWRRPLYYPHNGESIRQAAIREVSAVRGGVGVVDVSTLGKIDIQGRDAAEFLDRVYLNPMEDARDRTRPLRNMLREDGAVFDDGVTARLGEDHFIMTTTTLNAESVCEWLEFWLQTVWPDLDVFATPVTDQWFSAALNGPLARRLLERLTDIDVSDPAFPHMAIREADVAGIASRILRISFSGELAYENERAGRLRHGSVGSGTGGGAGLRDRDLWCGIDGDNAHRKGTRGHRGRGRRPRLRR